MDFGDWQRFGIECCIEKSMLTSSTRLSAVQGRVRVWIQGNPIGSLDEWGVALPQVLDALETLGEEDAARWHPELGSLSPAQQHLALDVAHFGNERATLPDDPRLLELIESEPFLEKVEDATILTNDAESFDGWNVFVLRPPDLGQFAWSWSSSDRVGVLTATTDVDETRRVVADFGAWLEAEQRTWTEG